jgi:hypothetical protein
MNIDIKILYSYDIKYNLDNLGGFMKIIKLGFLLFIILSLVFVLGCGTGGKANSNFKGANKVYYPVWWQTQQNPNVVYMYGMSTKVSENMSRDAAYSDAMLQAPQYVDAAIQRMLKNFEEEAGVKDEQSLALTSKVMKVVSNTKFMKAQIIKQETIITDDNHYKTFIQVAIPKNTIDKELINNIRNEEALYNQFKASPAFQELDKQISIDN